VCVVFAGQVPEAGECKVEATCGGGRPRTPKTNSRRRTRGTPPAPGRDRAPLRNASAVQSTHDQRHDATDNTTHAERTNERLEGVGEHIPPGFFAALGQLGHVGVAQLFVEVQSLGEVRQKPVVDEPRPVLRQRALGVLRQLCRHKDRPSARERVCACGVMRACACACVRWGVCRAVAT
jgi:hypothetical protein